MTSKQLFHTYILTSGADPDDVNTCVACILGQCLFFSQNRAINVRMKPEFRYDAAGIDILTNNITRFSLAAINGLKKDDQHGEN